MSLLALLPTTRRTTDVPLSGATQVPVVTAGLWERLHDPQTLRAALPGCRELQPVDGCPGCYRVRLSAGVGPVTGTSAGTLELVDVDGPDRYRLLVDGRGPTGAVRADVTFSLRARGPVTDVRYEGHAEVDGVLGSVGAGVLATATRRAVLRFFEAVARC